MAVLLQTVNLVPQGKHWRFESFRRHMEKIKAAEIIALQGVEFALTLPEDQLRVFLYNNFLQYKILQYSLLK